MGQYILGLYQLEMVLTYSRALDLIDAGMSSRHHLEVTLIAQRIFHKLERPECSEIDLMTAALLHDIGVFRLSTMRLIKAFSFEEQNNSHGSWGYQLLKKCGLYPKSAEMILDHHTPFNQKRGIPLGARIINLADRIAISINPDRSPLLQVEDITQKILSEKGIFFDPELVDVFEDLASKEAFWLDIISPRKEQLIWQCLRQKQQSISINELERVCQLFMYGIDFRSRFTAAHSSGVAHTGRSIGEIFNLSEKRMMDLKIAGYLHDLGKLAVPLEVLEKPSALTSSERCLIRSHSYYTDEILANLYPLKGIRTIASHHHEWCNGTGYPFRVRTDQESISVRILAVAVVSSKSVYPRGSLWGV